ncbi:MAG: type I-E CRISPR-associated protein Cse2/CasB [Thermomicrobiales bacterium]
MPTTATGSAPEGPEAHHDEQHTSRKFGQVAYGLARYLSSLVSDENRDRAKLAALRRGLGRPGGWDPQLASIVNPLITDVKSKQQEEICYQVSALFGLHPVSWPQSEDETERYANRTFGRSLHLYAVDKAKEGGTLEDIKLPLDRRMMALLDANSDDVFDHLRYAVSLLRGTEIPVDWGRLMVDLERWDDPDRHVQRAWSRAWWPAPYWISREAEASNTAEISV